MVEQDARLSVRDIASCTGISESSVQTILKKRLDLLHDNASSHKCEVVKSFLTSEKGESFKPSTLFT